VIIHRSLRFLSLFVVAIAVALALVAAEPARADGSDASRSAAARSAFEEGVRSADAHAYKEARAHFERALELRDSPVIRFNLATVLVELGQLVEASELFRALELDARASDDLRTRSEAQYEALRARFAKLVVTLQTPHTDVVVELDEHPLSAAALGVGMPVDPGSHAVRALRGGELRAEERVILGEGEERTLSLRVVEPEPAPVVAAPAARALPSPRAPTAPVVPERVPEHGSKRRRRWALGLTGAALAVGGAVAAYVAAASRSSAGGARGDFDPPSVGVTVTP
jgi:Tetratricopeptide repeat